MDDEHGWISMGEGERVGKRFPDGTFRQMHVTEVADGEVQSVMSPARGQLTVFGTVAEPGGAAEVILQLLYQDATKIGAGIAVTLSVKDLLAMIATLQVAAHEAVAVSGQLDLRILTLETPAGPADMMGDERAVNMETLRMTKGES